MAYEGDDMGNYEPEKKEIRNKRTASAGFPPVKIPAQMNPSDEITGFDPLLQSQNGSNDSHKEMEQSLMKGKQGLGEYDYGPRDESAEIAG